MPNAWPVQQSGSKGHDVRTVQYLLTHHGTPVGVDGIFGPGTKAAVEAFQTAKGLAADGIVGNQTWVALVVQVSSGNNGAAVSGAQGQLRSQGWRVPLDGAFGPATLRAVRDFQTARGLAVDGVVGQATWHALVAHFKHLSSPEASSTHLYDAWGADDRVTALTNATLAAVDLLLRGPRGTLTNIGCSPDPQLGEDHFVCTYLFEGGGINLDVRGNDTDGYYVESAKFFVD